MGVRISRVDVPDTSSGEVCVKEKPFPIPGYYRPVVVYIEQIPEI
jgi:hypothetical protein